MVTVLQGQNLIDIAIQTAGTAEASFDLALANDLTITEELPVGMELLEVAVQNRTVANYYTNKGLRPATALAALPEENIEKVFDSTFDSTFN